jgi:hypothetical protein
MGKSDSKIQPVRISFYGLGCKILVGRFSEIVWERLNAEAIKLNMPLKSAIFDPSFYNHLVDLRIRSLTDLGNLFKLSGLINSNHSIVEVRLFRKRKRSIRYDEIIDSNSLFPLFNTDVKNFNIDEMPRTLVVVEKEIGAINHFKLNTDAFSLEKLRFGINGLTVSNSRLNFEMLSGIHYDGVKLKPFGNDALVCGQYAIDAILE